MKKKDLRDGVEMSSNTLAKLGRNEYVALDVLVRTCDYLHCDIGDIMEVIPDEKENQGWSAAMSKLEEITAGSSVRGIVGNESVTIVAVQ